MGVCGPGLTLEKRDTDLMVKRRGTRGKEERGKRNEERAQLYERYVMGSIGNLN